jgi:hypothetical protein
MRAIDQAVGSRSENSSCDVGNLPGAGSRVARIEQNEYFLGRRLGRQESKLGSREGVVRAEVIVLALDDRLQGQRRIAASAASSQSFQIRSRP